jgi:hypothetical protein
VCIHSVSQDEGHENHKNSQLKKSQLNNSQLNKQILKLAYDCGRRLWRVNFPSCWIDNKIAGIDCLQNFMKRHKKVTLLNFVF